MLCHCDVWKSRSYVNSNLSLSLSLIFNNGQFYFKYYFLCHRSSSSERFSQVSMATSLFSIFIHQNTKSNTGLNMHNILEGRPKALRKMFLVDVDRLTLPRRPKDVIFGYIFKNAFLYRCFLNTDYRWTYKYASKHVEGNIKNSFCICIKFGERRSKDVWKMSLGEVRIMMFYGCPENVLYKIYYINIFKV